MRKDDYQIHQINWQGITIEIRWNPDYLHYEDNDVFMAHLEVEALLPERAPLPITRTGYRSHFTPPSEINEYGHPVSFVEAWLAEAAASPDWQAEQAKRMQLSPF